MGANRWGIDRLEESTQCGDPAESTTSYRIRNMMLAKVARMINRI
jgi:hypothetical protein